MRYSGRSVVALALDPEIMRKTGRVLLTNELAPAYGFTDVDGRIPNTPPAELLRSGLAFPPKQWRQVKPKKAKL